MARVLFAVAHPDDELLGCGGTVARHVENHDQVTVHIEVTEGLRGGDRITPAQRLAEKVGYKLSLGDSYELNARSARHIADRLPQADIIYTHHTGDLNSDHRAVSEAALIAGRFAQSVRTFETPSSTEWGLTPFVPNLYVDIRLNDKLALLEEFYASEMRDFPHPRSVYMVTALARWRGSTAGLDAAEAFHVVRDSWR